MARPKPGKKRRIAVVIDLDWPYRYHQDVFVGVQRYARQAEAWDCRIDPHATDTLAGCKKGKATYDGVVGRIPPALAKQAQRLRIPAVNVWLSSPAMASVPSVVQDMRSSGALAAEHLLARGLRSFSYLGYRRDRGAKLQWEGFLGKLRDEGYEASRELVPVNYSTGAAWAKFQATLDQWIATWTPPTGIYVVHDLTGRFLAEAIRRNGLNVPNDVALISGVNEPTIAMSGDPTLTSIEWGFDRQGFRAAELLDHLMDGKSPPSEPQMLPPVEIVVRQSTDVMAVDDSLVSRAFRFIAENSHRPIQVDDVATAVATTRRSLERRFRAVLGRTIADEITRLRMDRVKRLLVETDESIRNLSVQSGFGGPVQMCKVFHRLEGISPSEFRKQRT